MLARSINKHSNYSDYSTSHSFIIPRKTCTNIRKHTIQSKVNIGRTETTAHVHRTNGIEPICQCDFDLSGVVICPHSNTFLQKHYRINMFPRHTHNIKPNHTHTHALHIERRADEMWTPSAKCNRATECGRAPFNILHMNAGDFRSKSETNKLPDTNSSDMANMYACSSIYSWHVRTTSNGIRMFDANIAPRVYRAGQNQQCVGHTVNANNTMLDTVKSEPRCGADVGHICRRPYQWTTFRSTPNSVDNCRRVCLLTKRRMPDSTSARNVQMLRHICANCRMYLLRTHLKFNSDKETC